MCHLRASSFHDPVCTLVRHLLNNPGLQSLLDEANVRQQLSKLPLQTGDLLPKVTISNIIHIKHTARAI